MKNFFERLEKHSLTHIMIIVSGLTASGILANWFDWAMYLLVLDCVIAAIYVAVWTVYALANFFNDLIK